MKLKRLLVQNCYKVPSDLWVKHWLVQSWLWGSQEADKTTQIRTYRLNMLLHLSCLFFILQKQKLLMRPNYH